MIPFNVRKYLEVPANSINDYLYIILPEEAIEVPAILAWVQENQARAVLSYFAGGKHILQVNELGLKILNSAGIDLAIDSGGILKSNRVPIGVEVNTSVLDSDVPVGYSPNGQIYDEEGQVVRQKTVRELMIHIEGTEGKSLILCAEKTNGGNGTGLQHEELLRFRTQFPTYAVFTNAQRSAWVETNVIVEGE